MRQWLAKGTPGAVGAVKLSPAAALRVEIGLREAEAKEKLEKIYNIAPVTTAGRPSAALLQSRIQIGALTTAYGAGDGPWDAWYPGKAENVFKDRGWTWEKKGAVVVGGAGGDILAMQEGEKVKAPYTHRSPVVDIIYRARFHSWK